MAEKNAGRSTEAGGGAPVINRSMRLPEGEFFANAPEKSGIAIHHTVGGNAFSTFQHWVGDRTKSGARRVVGAAYIIDRDGTIYEVFEPKAWAFQFGLNWSSRRKLKFEQRFIGIEIASEGGLIEHLGKLYSFDRISAKTVKPKEEAFDYGSLYRGYRFFDLYSPEQIDQLVKLVNHLCDAHPIKRQVPYPPLEYYGERLVGFKGVIGHAMVRRDKSDPAPLLPFWDRLI